MKEKEIKKFFDAYYAEFVKELDKKDIELIRRIQSHGLQKGVVINPWATDDESIGAIEDAMKIVPGLPRDLIVYRVGKMKIKDRPYLSATYSKDIAVEQIADGDKSKLHKIVLRKGCKIIPLRILNEDGYDGEKEIIINQSKLKYRLTHYEYVE